ncbi:hypothetical protein JMJ77_0014388 [Colletotrichum scovillei]|uniref:Uncharacterized protein n=1 Tax=Colletotrichum scovillei TaxID=1209932 RepID=A0A9P7R4U4_9PEZI|nr:hypothetical protein JMJ77_0014388 [Colletotrichum scovillei]KAG7065916.1 hypothetical protein JMJ78_0012659 [Colletotrichum scovillei]KAG7068520.1 hypothetical protein JMJ76_0008206 [Colletotrichum scovillei]
MEGPEKEDRIQLLTFCATTYEHVASSHQLWPGPTSSLTPELWHAPPRQPSVFS